MRLIIVTIVFFVVVAAIIYVTTDLLPKWLFMRRHKVHTDAFEQFDLTGPAGRPDAQDEAPVEREPRP